MKRLSDGGGRSGGVLQAYARWTRAGQAEGVAAWYRLSSELEGTPPARSPARPAWALLSGLMMVSLSVWLVVQGGAGLPDPPGGAGGAHAGQGGAGGTAGAPRAPGVGFSL